MLTISSGHSADYLTGAVATGRENYYTGAVAAGEPPGRWCGEGAEALGLAGLVDDRGHDGAVRALPRPARPGVPRPGAVGRGRARSATPAAATRPRTSCTPSRAGAEPDASPERRERAAARGGQEGAAATSRSSTRRSACRSRSRCCTPRSRPRRSLPATPATRTTADGVGGHTATAVEDAIWAGNNAALDYLADKPATPGSGTTAARPAGGSTRTTGRWRRSSSTTPATTTRSCTSTTRSSTASKAPTGQWRTLDVAALYRYRGAAAAVGERTMEEHLTRSLGVQFATRPDGKAREVVGIRPEVMRPVLLPAPRDHRRRPRELVDDVRGQVRPRAEPPGAGPAAAAGHLRHPQGEVPRRRDRRAAPRPVGPRAARRGRRRPGRGRPGRPRHRRRDARRRRPGHRPR